MFWQMVIGCVLLGGRHTNLMLSKAFGHLCWIEYVSRGVSLMHPSQPGAAGCSVTYSICCWLVGSAGSTSLTLGPGCLLPPIVVVGQPHNQWHLHSGGTCHLCGWSCRSHFCPAGYMAHSHGRSFSCILADRCAWSAGLAGAEYPTLVQQCPAVGMVSSSCVRVRTC